MLGTWRGMGASLRRRHNQPPPTVTSVSVPAGDAAGGVALSVFGSGFTADAVPSFGAFAATGVTVVSPTEIQCLTPAAGSIPGLGAVDVVVTQASGVGTLVGGYTQQAQWSVDTDGAAERLQNVVTAGPLAVPFSVIGWWYFDAIGGRLVTFSDGTNNEFFGLSLSPGSKCLSCGVTVGGAAVIARNTAPNSTPAAGWYLCAFSVSVANVWKAAVAALGGAKSVSAGQVYAGFPACNRLFVNAGRLGTEYLDGKCAGMAIVAADVIGDDTFDAMLADPQHWPASPQSLFAPWLGGSAAAGFADLGSDGTRDLTCVAMEAGDRVNAYPGFAP